MTTWVGQNKNDTTWYPNVKKGGGLIWEDAIMRWVDALFTWEEVGSAIWTGDTKSETVWSGQTKN